MRGGAHAASTVAPDSQVLNQVLTVVARGGTITIGTGPDVLTTSATPRVTRIYGARFGSSVDNVSAAFTGLVTGDFGTFFGTEPILCAATHAGSMPSQSQADTMARAYAAFLATP